MLRMPTTFQTQPIVEMTPWQLCKRVSTFVGQAAECRRQIVAIAGPPAAGKSTLLPILLSSLQKEFGADRVVGLPMDGFHLDNVLLEQSGSITRKGAPHTFDVAGLLSLLRRLGTQESPIFAPEFDRANDLSRNCAIKIESNHDVVLLEGNYLLLDQPGWQDLNDHFDLSISIDVADDILKERLVHRWLAHGLSPDAALARASQNDLPNATTVREQSIAADIIYRPENQLMPENQ